MRLALYQPDIAQNTGTLLRTAACLGVGVDIIGPAGFDFSDRALRRAGLDYMDQVALRRHVNWSAFVSDMENESARIVLLTTKAQTDYTAFEFRSGDCLLLGRESAGVPQTVHDSATAEVRINMQPGMRSLNVAIAGAMVLGEALRQTK